jgi:hypothetical protein
MRRPRMEQRLIRAVPALEQRTAQVAGIQAGTQASSTQARHHARHQAQASAHLVLEHQVISCPSFRRHRRRGCCQRAEWVDKADYKACRRGARAGVAWVQTGSDLGMGGARGAAHPLAAANLSAR